MTQYLGKSPKLYIEYIMQPIGQIAAEMIC
jgi:hypothetical protein